MIASHKYFNNTFLVCGKFNVYDISWCCLDGFISEKRYVFSHYGPLQKVGLLTTFCKFQGPNEKGKKGSVSFSSPFRSLFTQLGNQLPEPLT